MDKISIIVPCYNEEQSVILCYNEIVKTTQLFDNTSFEFLFIDDGSKDKTLRIIKDLSLQDERVKYISFSRNFGKEAAIFAGLKNAKGNFVALMDADLQDPPELLFDMYNIVKKEDYDSVATRRISRKGESPIRSFCARLFYKIINKISNVDIKDGARDYRIMNRKFVDAILSMSEYNRFSKGLFGFVGFKTKWLEFENVERVAGNTKWSFWNLFKYSIEGIVSFSTMPLVISVVLGMVLCLLSFAFILFIVIRTLLFGDPVSGWPSTICIILLIGGIQLFSLGILGQYLAKTYTEVKNRPIYISREENINE